MITPLEVEKMVLAKLPGSKVCAHDMTGTGDHFEIHVESKEFAGKSLIEQHQLVFAALEKEMDRRIHAVKLKTKVPAEKK